MHRFYSCTFLKYLFRATTLATHAARPFPAPSISPPRSLCLPPTRQLSRFHPAPLNGFWRQLQEQFQQGPGAFWREEKEENRAKRTVRGAWLPSTPAALVFRQTTGKSPGLLGNAAAEHPFVPPCLRLQGCLAFPSLPFPSPVSTAPCWTRCQVGQVDFGSSGANWTYLFVSGLWVCSLYFIMCLSELMCSN